MAKKPGFYDLVKLLSNQNTFSFLMGLNPSAMIPHNYWRWPKFGRRERIISLSVIGYQWLVLSVNLGDYFWTSPLVS